jgi:hypothetical protein
VIGCGAYLYFLTTLNPETQVGQYKWFSLALFGSAAALATRQFTKFVHRLVLVEKGEAVRVERYPLFGFGHMKLKTVNHWDIDHITPYTRFQRFGIGKGFYQMQFQTTWYKRNVTDYAIFSIKNSPDMDVLKLLAVGRPVNDKTLRVLNKSKKL